MKGVPQKDFEKKRSERFDFIINILLQTFESC